MEGSLCLLFYEKYMRTICEVHEEISEITKKSWYSGYPHYGKLPDDPETLKEIIEEYEDAMKNIDNKVVEARWMWQTMENWLRNRRDFMKEKWIEEEYKS